MRLIDYSVYSLRSPLLSFTFQTKQKAQARRERERNTLEKDRATLG